MMATLRTRAIRPGYHSLDAYRNPWAEPVGGTRNAKQGIQPPPPRPHPCTLLAFFFTPLPLCDPRPGAPLPSPAPSRFRACPSQRWHWVEAALLTVSTALLFGMSWFLNVSVFVVSLNWEWFGVSRATLTMRVMVPIEGSYLHELSRRGAEAIEKVTICLEYRTPVGGGDYRIQRSCCTHER